MMEMEELEDELMEENESLILNLKKLRDENKDKYVKAVITIDRNNELLSKIYTLTEWAIKSYYQRRVNEGIKEKREELQAEVDEFKKWILLLEYIEKLYNYVKPFV